MADQSDELLLQMQIAEDKTRSMSERLGAMLAMCRIADHEELGDTEQNAENDTFIGALLSDERGQEIIVRTVLRLVRNA